MDGELSADDLAAVLDDDALRIVDIRTPPAFARGHIPGSENIPFQELPQRVDQLAGADRVVTVCPHGKSSKQAARLIASYEGVSADTQVESLACGIDGWPGDLEQSSDTAADEGPETDAPF
ncbi:MULTISPECIES: rhodanese-like domain-containing protein [Halobacterium]|uniref:Rhodanese domain protein n=1 Tax=Halobacterium salinarum (strain ATCC 33171 / DSM 3754 / JCM 8978 / NBRC 102687 / NCIMB 764 / 91-R6) TaxID=2597657 RepID=A0A4D6GQC1_HALS9|nr:MULTISPECIES: rhodanese-like domain-containing protein [Halobacterium]MCF2207988.1 rhodanese-like domain-containing protein [Halobacterium salinarum]MCF2241604.1 rhodanese-like domain-containing protein [Halobacterium salinarum]MDL0119237.1 rhodanese-like domain-containing protein [Halobacterium salinarum]MDL0121925.1 rhodanese-like domain-containing protein [Halobacterium salinarum]MDL0124785.1 rhodanese-like domain-containing protein [Halobacterium salinarum]